MMSSVWFHIKIRKIIKISQRFLKIKIRNVGFEGIVISPSVSLNSLNILFGVKLHEGSLIHEIASGSVTTSMNRSTVKSRFLFFKLSKCQSKLCQQYQQDHQEHMIWWRDMVIGTGGRKGTNKMQFRFFFAVHVWLFALGFLAALMNFVLLALKGACIEFLSKKVIMITCPIIFTNKWNYFNS